MRNWSIKKKVLVWFGVCGVLALILLGLGISSVLHRNAEATVSRLMQEQLGYLNTSVRQTLAKNDLKPTEENLASVIREVAEDYHGMFGDTLNYYTTYGELVYGEFDEISIRGQKTDLMLALEGENAYTIVESRKQSAAYGSFCMAMDGVELGILRVRCDETELYREVYRNLYTVIFGVAAMFLGLGAALGILLKRFFSPVENLSREIRDITANPSQIHEMPVTCGGEVGELTRVYNRMAATNRRQFLELEREKDNLKRTLAFRKSFYDNLTHELKTPITIILGYAEMMEQTDLEDREFAQKGLTEIITESKRLRDMVAGLLEESKSLSEEFCPRPVDLCELVGNVCASMEIKAKRYHTEIISQLCDAYILGEPQRLRQLFGNLLDNAIKYGTGEDVTLRMQAEETQVSVSVLNRASEDALGDVNRIFMPFYRSRDEKEREEGSVGLGLSICKDIAYLHKAEITARTDGGTVEFRVVFPSLTKGDAEHEQTD